LKLIDIANTLECKIYSSLEDKEITSVSSYKNASETSITFLSDNKFKSLVEQCGACAVIVKKGETVPNKINLEVDDPYLGYALVSQLFEDKQPVFGHTVHGSSTIDPDTVLHESISVGPGSVIGANCSIGSNTVISACCVIENNVSIGKDCRIDSGVIIRSNCDIGDRVIIQSGTVIGSEGFGNARDGRKFVRIPCFGSVIIENDVEIGANVTIDRGNFEPTILHRGVRIDNLVQIAHNVEIDEHSAIASQTGISGSTKIGKSVLVGGQAGFVGHIEVGDGACIGAKAGVSKNVRPGQTVTGYPARDLMNIRRVEAIQQRLPEMKKELKRLRNEIEELKRIKNNG
jgi:UDP-3-O-[3-hydroxymyristoyl] glucosamine N-acyltransferase